MWLQGMLGTQHLNFSDGTFELLAQNLLKD